MPRVEFPPAVPFTAQVTLVLLEFETLAWNCWVDVTLTEVDPGVIVILTGGGALLLLPPPPPQDARTARESVSKADRTNRRQRELLKWVDCICSNIA